MSIRLQKLYRKWFVRNEAVRLLLIGVSVFVSVLLVSRAPESDEVASVKDPAIPVISSALLIAENPPPVLRGGMTLTPMHVAKKRMDHRRRKKTPKRRLLGASNL